MRKQRTIMAIILFVLSIGYLLLVNDYLNQEYRMDWAMLQVEDALWIISPAIFLMTMTLVLLLPVADETPEHMTALVNTNSGSAYSGTKFEWFKHDDGIVP